MPSHKIHRAVSRMVLGKAHDSVNKVMDWPYKILGKRHRIVFHDPLSIVALFGNDKAKLEAAALHLLVDKACENPSVEKLLQLLVEGQT